MWKRGAFRVQTNLLETFFLRSDITGDIMSPKKLKKLRKKIAELRRRGGISAGELEAIAQKLGRKRHKRGKEPTWVSEILLDSFPISIPSHGSDLNRFTARAILDQLEQDVDAIEDFYATQSQSGANKENEDEPIN
jgi:hypothetical protein